MATRPITPVTHLRAILLILAGITSIKAITRQQILETARRFAQLTWFADSANTVGWNDMYEEYGCSQHLATDWEPGYEYQGMAYGFGQNDDTSGYLLDLADEEAAGNHSCHYFNYGEATGIYPPDWAAGIDCSALVCRCWEVPRTHTSGLYDKYRHVDKEEVKPGDILVKPASHAVLVADPGQNPPFGTLAIYEASGSACRVWYNPGAYWSAYAEYQAVSLFEEEEDSIVDTLDQVITCDPPVATGEILLTFPSAWDELEFGIFDASGRLVYKEKLEEPFTKLWQGADQKGSPVPSGLYFVRVLSPLTTHSQGFVFLR